MQLQFLGTGSAYNPNMKSTSAFLSMGSTMLLFDCGETVFESLHERALLDKFDAFIVFITHFHSDHIGSLGSFISYCFCKLKKEVFVFFPNADICKLLQMTGVPHFMYTYLSEIPSRFSDRLVAIPVPVHHDPTIPCFGYQVTVDHSTFFYGGDSAKIPEVILDLLLHGKIDIIYQDTSYVNKGDSDCHGTLEGLCEQVPARYREKVVCMHFDHDFTEQVRAHGFHPANR